MIIAQWLSKAIQKLESASVPTARLDAEVLLADILDKDRSWIHANPDFRLQRSDLRKLKDQINRRAAHEPLAYILGKKEFFGREFIVSPDTLTPRPETETMVELFMELFQDPKSIIQDLSVVDVGTGSGCIIITAALELSKIQDQRSKISFTGLDISQPALKIAQKNSNNLLANVDFIRFDLLKDELSKIQGPRSTIYLANLPYVPEDFHINLAASHEPEFAIFGGKDGLDYYRKMFQKLSKNTKFVLTESLPPQHEELVEIAKKAGFELQKTQDLIQLFQQSS